MTGHDRTGVPLPAGTAHNAGGGDLGEESPPPVGLRYVGYRTYGPHLVLNVLGEPVGQGRITTFGKGRTVHSNADRLLPWRAQVQRAAEEAVVKRPVAEQWPIEGPVAVDVTFTVRKPLSAPKKRRTWPVKRPDTSHLLRAVEDALQAAGVYRDDSQIIQETARKAYPNEHIQALHVPGAVIYVYTVGESP